MSSTSLVETVSPFLNQLNSKDTPVAHRAVSRFALLGEVLVYNETLKQLTSKDARELFLTQVKHTLKTLPTIPGIWRATFFAIKKNIPWADAAPKFGVSESDIKFCWDGLDSEDKTAVKEAASSLMTFDRLAPKILKDMITELDKYCAQTAYKRLRFLQTTDHAVGLEDLKNDLLTHALLAIRKYEHFSDDGQNHNITKIKNYVKRSITNHALNMINFYTSKSRARIENITAHCGNCKYCKAGATTHCLNAVNNFRATTVSLDALLTPQESRDPHQDFAATEESEITDKMVIDYLKQDSDPGVVQFIDIVTERNIPPDFEQWLEKNYKLSYDGLDPYKLGKFAMYFCGIDESKVKKALRTKLRS